ncbi:heme-degrading domain-containing protein [Paenibacillus hexagrammi]|uniref:Heme-degrading domain-containing protein n=1 Tax=Paenibacillus hexagrammi TaxID=2908839 RepID=A0ABY3SP82_9BACL|nr:heme-degrading domain-containing protein [Paenibacillus sp. YPD9-1]UJF34906.1 heme-degrading domain-containing protein [Paenibacillus sp. YPD9-1]
MKPYDELLQELLEQEERLQFIEFTNDTAYQVGTGIIAKAVRERKQIVVDIRKDGEVLFYSRMNGTSSHNDEWVRWKNNVVHHYKHSSYYMHVSMNAKESSVENDGLDPNEYKAEGGSFPLIVKGSGVVGTITVSGLPGDQDHGMVTAVLQELLMK